METEIYTQEELTKIKNLIYDSVITINELLKKEILDELDNNSLFRNKNYIKYYLEKDWFVSALTAKQKKELETIIK